MEKRTILAIVLSLLVLFVYGAVTGGPKKQQTNFTQITDNKTFVENLVPAEPAQKATESQKNLTSQLSLESEKTVKIDSQELLVEFTNLGGTIKSVVVKKYNYPLPLTNVIFIPGLESQNFVLKEQGDNWVEYTLETSEFKISKRFELPPNEHLIKASLKIEQIKDMSKLESLKLQGFMLDMSNVDKSKLASEGTLFEYAVSSNYAHVFRKSHAIKFSSKEIKSEAGIVNWIGFRDRYFCAVVKPLFKVERYEVNPISDDKLSLDFPLAEVTNSLKQGNPADFLIYFGPQDLSLLKSYKAGLDEMMSFSNFGLFDICAKMIYQTLILIHKIVPNWGVCIILISLIIYGALYPLTIMGMSSMKKTQALQPQIAKLREQYKSNPQKLNKEVMDLYKEYKVNPFAGCFPLVLQMPIFIGLYQVLWRSTFFKGSGFLWIKDLAEPDRLFMLPFSMPFLGNEFNILPILMAIVMFFQQKITMKSMVATDPDQITQQKMMAIFLPIFMSVIFYKFASGLSLYFTIFYSLSTLTQYKMSKLVVLK